MVFVKELFKKVGFEMAKKHEKIPRGGGGGGGGKNVFMDATWKRLLTSFSLLYLEGQIQSSDRKVDSLRIHSSHLT